MQPELQNHLTAKVKKADRIILFCAIGFLVLATVTFGLLIIQTQNNIDRMTKLFTLNHVVTRDYIKCVAEAYSAPVLNSNDRIALLDKCADTADQRLKDASQNELQR